MSWANSTIVILCLANSMILNGCGRGDNLQQQSQDRTEEWRVILEYEIRGGILPATLDTANKMASIAREEPLEIVIEKYGEIINRDRSLDTWIICSLLSVAEVGELKKLLIDSKFMLCEECDGVPILWIILLDGNVDLLAKALESGCDPNAFSDGMTPLVYSILDDNKEAIDLLLAHGADPDLSELGHDSARELDYLRGTQYFD